MKQEAVHKVNEESLRDFFAFLQCQLRMQARERLDTELELECPVAAEMWPHYEEWVKPSLGKRDKWMPFHTVLGAHELFAVQQIHHRKDQWDQRQRFIALFVYRAHCRGDLFNDLQLDYLKRPSFWKDPCSYFSQNGVLTKAMIKYRKNGKPPMQTHAFRCIPARLLENNDENLVLNICNRTSMLIKTADKILPILNDSSKNATEKFQEISTEFRARKGIGDTWCKMLTVSLDIAFPSLGLLKEHCDVGTGAIGGLERLMPTLGSLEGDQPQAQSALDTVTAAINAKDAAVDNAVTFWKLLPEVEQVARDTYSDHQLVLDQMDTPQFGLSAATVQVQLCEWRQLHDYLKKRQSRKRAHQAPEAEDAEDRSSSCETGPSKPSVNTSTVAGGVCRLIKRRRASDQTSDEKEIPTTNAPVTDLNVEAILKQNLSQIGKIAQCCSLRNTRISAELMQQQREAKKLRSLCQHALAHLEEQQREKLEADQSYETLKFRLNLITEEVTYAAYATEDKQNALDYFTDCVEAGMLDDELKELWDVTAAKVDTNGDQNGRQITRNEYMDSIRKKRRTDIDDATLGFEEDVRDALAKEEEAEKEQDRMNRLLMAAFTRKHTMQHQYDQARKEWSRLMKEQSEQAKKVREIDWDAAVVSANSAAAESFCR